MLFKGYTSDSRLINTEPSELLRLRLSELIASESVVLSHGNGSLTGSRDRSHKWNVACQPNPFYLSIEHILDLNGNILAKSIVDHVPMDHPSTANARSSTQAYLILTFWPEPDPAHRWILYSGIQPWAKPLFWSLSVVSTAQQGMI